MPIQGGLRFEFSGDRQPEEVRFSIEDLDAVTLRAFVREADAMREAVNRQGGFSASLNVSWREGEPVLFSGSEPTVDQRAVVLHRLRPFVLQNERLYFHSIRGIVARSADSEYFRQLLKNERDRFTAKLMQQEFQISIESLVLNSEAALDLWLNAFEYHRDEQKALELIKLHDPYPLDASRPIFIFVVQEKMLAVFNLARIVYKMLSGPEQTRPNESA